MPAKKKSTNITSQYILSILLIGLGIYLVVMGVLSGNSDNARSFVIAAGLGFFAAGTITAARR